MAFITPRRRLLITAPLAIILPAGLLVYLGLRVVGMLEVTLAPIINSDIQRHQETVERMLGLEMYRRQCEFGAALRLWISERRYEDETLRTQDLGERLILKQSLPFVQFIFSGVGDSEVAFYRRDTVTETDIQAGRIHGTTLSAWVRCPPPSEAVVRILLEEMDQLGLPLHIEDELPFFPFYRQAPSGYYVGAVNSSPQFGQDADSHGPVGFIYDLDYVKDKILAPLLQDTLFFGDASYPLEVVDKEDRVIATSVPNQPYRFDSGYLPDPVSLYPFYFWRLRYAKDAGLEKFWRREEYRRIHIPLIIAAAVIMILAVLGSVRNLARELKLAEMRSDFVARVSHELRTPLGLIRLFAETLEMGRIEDKDHRREYLHTITKESERLSKLIDNVLDFSKIEAGQKQYQLALDSIADIVENVTDSMQFHMSRNNVDLRVRVEPNLPMVRLDREAMALALWNLLSNAVKYSGNGRFVEVEARRTDGEVVLSVRDHGIGIAPQEVKRICQQFYRVDDPRVQERGGSGLGLSVVKHIIDGHHGRLTIESTPGAGSTFSLCVPVPPRPPGPSEAKEGGGP